MEKESGKRRVLIVDDHPVLRESIRMIIDDTPDFTVAAEAETAADAIDACRSGAFDVILLDIRLPDQQGCDVARKIRSSGADIKIIALSMRDEETVRRQMFNAGSDAFVSKAAGAEALIETMRSCFQNETI